MKRWNGQTAERKQTVEFTEELLERLGASGRSYRVLANELGVSHQWLSKQINKNDTNLNAYKRGKLKNESTSTGKI